MTATRIRIGEVTLSDAARSAAERHGIPANEVRMARALSVSTHSTPEWVVAIGQLRDGRRVRMCCSHELPSHVVSLRLA